MNGRFAAVKVIEGDQDIIRQLKLSENELEMMEHSIIEMETDRGLDRNAAMATCVIALLKIYVKSL